MAPTAKESTRTHPGVWLLGVAYHLGVFTALGVLAWVLLGDGPGHAPANVLLSSALLSSALLVVDTLLVAGALGGLGLLGRRAGSPVLRGLSHPDDYVANLLTTVFIALAAVRMWSPRLEPALLVAAMALFCYMPVGKIRHCVFFFLSRYHLGRHYGRRGTFPLRH
jgi:nitrate reductase gamma subunit